MFSDICYLRAGRSGDQIPVGGGQDFPHSSRPALSPTQPPIQCVPRFSRGVKRPGHGVDHTSPSRAEVKERVQLYLYSPFGPSWPVIEWTYGTWLTKQYLHYSAYSHFLLQLFAETFDYARKLPIIFPIFFLQMGLKFGQFMGFFTVFPDYI